MRTFFLLRRPLPRRTVIFCHMVAQLGLLTAGAAWLLQRTPWLSSASWTDAWPGLVMGTGILLLAMVGVRLLAEVLMLPHYVAASMRQGFVPGAVVTRSFDRRPAVHDPQDAWVNESRATVQPAILDEEAVGNARVIQPRRPFSARRSDEMSPSDRDGGASQQEPSF